jgi:hypothetical protein
MQNLLEDNVMDMHRIRIQLALDSVQWRAFGSAISDLQILLP